MQPAVDTATSDHDSLVRIETKLNVFITSQADHEARIRVLEKVAQEDTGAKDTKRNSKGVLIAELAAGAATIAAIGSLWVAIAK